MYLGKDVHELNLRELTEEELLEESLVNLAYGLLTEQKQPLAFTEIIVELEKLNARTPEQMDAYLNQFYTDMNIDGRFMVLAENRWGLREWYAIDQVEEEIAPTVKTHKKKVKAALLNDDLLLDDEEIEIDLDLVEEFDAYDDDDDDEDDDDLAVLDVIDEDKDLDEDEEELEIDIEIDLDEDEDEDDLEEDEEEEGFK